MRVTSTPHYHRRGVSGHLGRWLYLPVTNKLDKCMPTLGNLFMIVTCFNGKLLLLPHSLHSSPTRSALLTTFIQGSIVWSLLVDAFPVSSLFHNFSSLSSSAVVAFRLFLLKQTNTRKLRSAKRNSRRRQRIKSLISRICSFHFFQAHFHLFKLKTSFTFTFTTSRAPCQGSPELSVCQNQNSWKSFEHLLSKSNQPQLSAR